MVLIDANVICAYRNTKDVHHEKAVALLNRIAPHWILTDYIFDEIMGVLKRKVGIKEALLVGEYLLHSEFQLYYITSPVFHSSWKLFTQNKHLSFTDCTCIAMMKSLGLTDIATFDKGFHNINGITVVTE
jgi:predicted nucleic acid-binding protein